MNFRSFGAWETSRDRISGATPRLRASSLRAVSNSGGSVITMLIHPSITETPKGDTPNLVNPDKAGNCYKPMIVSSVFHGAESYIPAPIAWPGGSSGDSIHILLLAPSSALKYAARSDPVSDWRGWKQWACACPENR